MLEQPCFLRLIFQLCDGARLLGLLQVDQLLTQRAAGELRVAIADGCHTSSEAEQRREGYQGGNSYFFHVALWG